MLRHALRAALPPVVSYLGPATAGIITGSVVIEKIFGIPGIGRLILALNLRVDLLYGWLGPRVHCD